MKNHLDGKQLRSILSIVACLTAVLTAAGIVYGGDFEDAAAAYARGDYSETVRLIIPLARGGDPNAMFNLGMMYDNGEGVPKSITKAQYWYRKATLHGFTNTTANRNFAFKKWRFPE